VIFNLLLTSLSPTRRSRFSTASSPVFRRLFLLLMLLHLTAGRCPYSGPCKQVIGTEEEITYHIYEYLDIVESSVVGSANYQISSWNPSLHTTVTCINCWNCQSELRCGSELRYGTSTFASPRVSPPERCRNPLVHLRSRSCTVVRIGECQELV
jgi:hypothetical protein